MRQTLLLLFIALGLLSVGCSRSSSSSGDDDDAGDDDDDNGSDDDDDATDPPPDDDPIAADFAAALEQTLSNAQEDYAPPGIQVAVKVPGYAVWTSASGSLGVDDRLKIGEISQTFVATLALMLEDTEELPLSTVPGEWVDGVTWGCSLNQAINHVGGLPDYANDPSFDWSGHPHPEDLVDLVINQPLDFQPGSNFAYSRTGYPLTALAIEDATGNDWEDELRTRILEPLQLNRTRVPAVGDGWGDVAPGFSGGNDVTNSTTPAAHGPAGNMTSTASNLARFGGHVFEGELLSGQARYDMFGHPFSIGNDAWGLGVQVFGIGPFDTPLVAALGSVEGYTSFLGYREDLGVVVAVMANAWTDEQGGSYARWIANEFITVAEQYVTPPVGDDDDFVPSPEPSGQMRFATFEPLPHIGAPANPGHTGVMIGGYWDYNNDGGTIGYVTVTSADYSSGQAVDAVECQVTADGTYNPADREYGITGTLTLENWGPASCDGWNEFGTWRDLFSEEWRDLHLVPREDVQSSWEIEDDIAAWEANASPQASVPFVILTELDGVWTANPQTPPFATAGHYWQLPKDRDGGPPN